MARLVRFHFNKNKILLLRELQSLIADVACVNILLLLTAWMSSCIVKEFDGLEFLIMVCTFISCFKSGKKTKTNYFKAKK